MLTEHELVRIAETYAHQHYGRAHGDHYQLVRVAELSEPAGTYFTAAYQPGAELIGDGGFFVMRRDGSVIAFGSGDFNAIDARLIRECVEDGIVFESDAWYQAILRPLVLEKMGRAHPS